MRRAYLTVMLCGLLSAGCAAPGVPGSTVARVLTDIRTAAELLRAESYRATFDMRLDERSVRWAGTMRTLGGLDAIWSADGTASDNGRMIDAVSMVDAGGVRYLDSGTETFRGYEWVALEGGARNSYYWRFGRPVPLPDADPFLWCDLSAARMAVTARTTDGGLRYRLTGWSPGPTLAAALRRAGLTADSPDTALDLTLTPPGRPARLDVTVPGARITLLITGTATRERIKIPSDGQFISLPHMPQ